MPDDLTDAQRAAVLASLDRAIEVIGGVGALADRIGVWQGAVSNWKARGRIPAAHCPSIERETRGAVTCEALCPDVDWAYLRRSAHDDSISANVT